jgi:hypothetical protein
MSPTVFKLKARSLPYLQTDASGYLYATAVCLLPGKQSMVQIGEDMDEILILCRRSGEFFYRESKLPRTHSQ